MVFMFYLNYKTISRATDHIKILAHYIPPPESFFVASTAVKTELPLTGFGKMETVGLGLSFSLGFLKCKKIHRERYSWLLTF